MDKVGVGIIGCGNISGIYFKMMREVYNNILDVKACADLDMSRAKIENEDELYLDAIPYMQFPLLLAGRPFTGERGMIPGVRYVSDNDFWMKRCREIWKLKPVKINLLTPN